MNPCTSCHAGCCRSFAVPLTGADILRIERDLKLSFWQFVCRWADPQGKIARSYAPQFRFRDEPETPFVVCLIHDASRNFPHTTRCRFLVECAPDAEHPLGLARCGIHPSRPSACRVFPSKLNDTGELAVLGEVPARGRAGSDAAHELCPRPWEPADVDPLDTLHDLVVATYEMRFFHALARVWNRDPGEWSVFPEFLHAVYANRVVRESADTADEFPATIPIAGRGRKPISRAA